MAEWKSYRKESRKDYGQEAEGGLCLDQIRTGALLRIADATELVAKRYQDLIDERDRCKLRLEEKEQSLAAEHRRVIALRAVITRMKRKMK